jgi:hypothetical protein
MRKNLVERATARLHDIEKQMRKQGVKQSQTGYRKNLKQRGNDKKGYLDQIIIFLFEDK